MRAYTCSACAHRYTESIAASGHTWNDATCTTPKICSACGTISGNALGHSYTGHVTQQPICTANGVKTYTCSVCAHSYIESIAALGHTWNNATCTTPKTCSACGATSGDALGHDYDDVYDVDCNECGAIREIVGTPGDADGNGEVTNRDLGLLQRHLNGWQNVNVDLSACDVDGNGEVTNRDLGLLQRYLNGWEVELK